MSLKGLKFGVKSEKKKGKIKEREKPALVGKEMNRRIFLPKWKKALFTLQI